MKIWCQLPQTMPVENFGPYYELIQKTYAVVKGKDTEIVIKDVPTSIAIEGMAYTGLRFFNDREVLKSILRAEKEGFDGVSIACFFDPALTAAKQLLTIPVTGLGESAMHLACMMGLKFAIITSDPRYVSVMEESISSYGLRSRAIERNPVRSLTISWEELFGSIMGGDYTPVVENFRLIAGGCIEDGAEVLISGCGLTSPMLSQAGVTEVDRAAVIDPLQASLKLTEMLVDLYKGGVPTVSRKSLYASVSSKGIEEALAPLG